MKVVVKRWPLPSGVHVGKLVADGWNRLGWFQADRPCKYRVVLSSLYAPRNTSKTAEQTFPFSRSERKQKPALVHQHGPFAGYSQFRQLDLPGAEASNPSIESRLIDTLLLLAGTRNKLHPLKARHRSLYAQRQSGSRRLPHL